MRSNAALLPLAALLLVSCSADPLETEIEGVFSRSRSTVYPAEAARLPWRTGQWTLSRITLGGREILMRALGGESRGFREIAITRQVGDSFWLEVREVWSGDETRCAFLVEGSKSGGPQGLRVLEAKFMDHAEVVESTDLEELPASVRRLREQLGMMAGCAYLVNGMGEVRKLSVPAGTFEETCVVPASVSLVSGARAGQIWFTDAVPIFHQAKMVSQQVSYVWWLSSSREELVDFGNTGARSIFFKDDHVPSATQAASVTR